MLKLFIPSLSGTLRGIKAALNAEFHDVPGLDAFKPTNLLYPLSVVLTLLIQQVYQLGRAQASEATPMFSSGSNLDGWLEHYGVAVPDEQKATGAVLVTGGGGKALPVGTAMIRADGALFRTTSSATFGADPESLTVGVEAEDVGAFYNTDTGEELELAGFDDDISPVAVSQGITGGSDQADDDSKRTLMRTRLSQSSVAGSAKDYELRSLSFSGSIGRVFVAPAGRGSGTVVIFPLNKNPEGAEPWEVTIPLPGELAALQAQLSRDDVAKINDRILVEALTVRTVDISIAITPNTAEVQNAVRDRLRLLFADFYTAGKYTIPSSEIGGAISAVDGEISHTVLDIDGGGPNADPLAKFGRLLQVGTITFTPEVA